MEELRRRLWNVAIPLLLEKLVDAYGQTVAPKCLPIAAKTLRTDHLNDPLLIEVEDADSWIETDLPIILEELVVCRSVKDTAIAVKISNEGTACDQFEIFLGESYKLINDFQESVRRDINVAALKIERARDIALDRLFSPLELAEKNLRELSPMAPTHFAGKPPVGNHFFCDACHSFVSRIPNNITHHEILNSQVPDWRFFLKKRFKYKYQDASDLLLRIEADMDQLPPESPDEPIGGDQGGTRAGGEISPASSFGGLNPDLDPNEQGGSDLGLQEMIQEASHSLLAAVEADSEKNQLALDIYQLHKTAYLNPEHFLEETRRKLINRLPRLQEEYRDARRVLELEYDLNQIAQNKADEALDRLCAEKRLFGGMDCGAELIEAADVWGRSLLHSKRPKNPTDRETEESLRQQKDQIIANLRNRFNQRGRQVENDTSGLLNQLDDLQDRLLEFCLNYKPFTALEDALESIEWIEENFSGLVDRRHVISKRARIAVAMRAFQHEEKRRLFLIRFGADGNLGRYRARKSYNPAFPGALTDVDTDSLWVRSQGRIMGILGEIDVIKTQPEISESLTRGGILILKSIINYSVINSRLNIFSRGGLLGFVRECFDLYIRERNITRYVWDEDCDGDSGNRLTQPGQIENIVWLVNEFPDVRFTLRIRSSFSESEDRIFRKSSRYPQNLLVNRY